MPIDSLEQWRSGVMIRGFVVRATPRTDRTWRLEVLDTIGGSLELESLVRPLRGVTR
jgi:hypothetical protein